MIITCTSEGKFQNRKFWIFRIKYLWDLKCFLVFFLIKGYIPMDITLTDHQTNKDDWHISWAA